MTDNKIDPPARRCRSILGHGTSCSLRAMICVVSGTNSQADCAGDR
jgi:hypothetical protein